MLIQHLQTTLLFHFFRRRYYLSQSHIWTIKNRLAIISTSETLKKKSNETINLNI
jgi:hypothetical protein